MLLVWASIPERPVSPIADVHRRLIILKMRVAQAFVVFAEQQYPKGTLVTEL